MVLVPGFGHTRSLWQRVEEALSQMLPRLELSVVDLPDALSFEQTASAIGELGGQASYCGYSLGGRLCIQLAVSRPDLVQSLIVVSSTAGIEDQVERARRLEADLALAERALKLGSRAFLEEWVSQPLFSALREEALIAERASAYTPERLAHQLDALSQGRQPSLWARLAEITCPVMFVAGEADERYMALAAKMAERVPGALTRSLEGGHCLPLEAPRELAAAIAQFLSRLSYPQQR